MTDLHPFIAGLPKAELHVHHVGSASPRIVAELAARHPDSKVPTDPEALVDYFTFTDFAHFIDVYLSVVDLIRTPEDVRLLTFEVARDMARQNIRYAELTVTPFCSTRRGIPEERLHGGHRGRPEGRRGRAGRRTALVLRHPGRGGAGGRRGDRPARRRPAPGGPGLLRARRPRDRRAPPAVQAVLRPGHRRGPALRAARRRDDGTRDRLGRAHRICAPSASATAPAPPRTRSCWRTSPSTASRWRSAPPPTSPPARCRTSTSTPSRRWSRPVCWSPSTATTRRCSAPTSTTSTRSPPGCSAWTSGASPRLAKNAVEASFLDAAGKAKLAAEIDTYTARWLAGRGVRPRRLPRSRATWHLRRQWPHANCRCRGPPRRPLPRPREHARLAAFRAPTGRDAVEIDVRLTRDGVPVLLHDSLAEAAVGAGPAPRCALLGRGAGR